MTDNEKRDPLKPGTTEDVPPVPESSVPPGSETRPEAPSADTSDGETSRPEPLGEDAPAQREPDPVEEPESTPTPIEEPESTPTPPPVEEPVEEAQAPATSAAETAQAAPEAGGEASGDEAPEDADAEASEEPVKDTSRMQWYIIHTYSGFENKVKESLRQRADAYGMGDKIGEVLVPTEDVVEIRDGKKYTTKKKFFPGYVLVQMEMSDEAWHAVRSTPKVTGFVGGGQRPLPMSQDEVDRILSQVHVTKDKPKPKFDYRVGETVRITDGPFSNFTGVVEEINEDRATLKVMVSIFGRATPVELEFHQVKRPE